MQITLNIMGNPRYTSDGKSIILDCTLTHEDGKVEKTTFCAMNTDIEDYGRQIYADAMASKYGAIAPYIKPK